MWKLVVLVIVIAYIDWKSLSIKEYKKEFLLYTVLCIIAIGLGFYSENPNRIYFTEFIAKITMP